MKAILKIGMDAFLVKDANQAAAVIKVLGQARRLSRDWHRPGRKPGDDTYFIDGTVEVSFQMLPNASISQEETPKVEILSHDQTRQLNGKRQLLIGQ